MADTTKESGFSARHDCVIVMDMSAAFRSKDAPNFLNLTGRLHRDIITSFKKRITISAETMTNI